MKLFTDHPHAVGETYWQHLCFALMLAVEFLVLACAIVVHGLLPFLMPNYTSTRIDRLNRILALRAAAQVSRAGSRRSDAA